MSRSAAFFLTAIALATSPPANAEDISASDNQIIASRLQKVIEMLEKGDAGGAVSAFWSSSKLITSTDARLENLRNQITNSIRLYGPISECSPLKSDDFSALVASRQFVCAHKSYATRWQFVLTKLPEGWSGARMVFDDKIEAGPF